MPAIAAHHFFGRSVLKQLPNSVTWLYDPALSTHILHLQTFDWGCQGPDILFYHLFPTGRRENFGTLLHHEKIPQTFFYLFHTVHALQAPWESHLLTAYLMGYVCHYCLDRQTHPYINDRCRSLIHPKRVLSPTIQHRMLEADLERVYLEKYAPEIPVRDFRLDQLHPTNYQVIHPIARLLTGLGRNLFGLRTTPTKVEESMRLMNHLQTILHDPQHKKREFYFGLEKAAGYPDFFTALIPPEVPLEIDSLNLTQQSWHNAYGQKQWDSYWELETQARRSACSLILTLHALQPESGARSVAHAFPFSCFSLDYLGKPCKM